MNNGEKYKADYERGYITKEQLKRWVVINAKRSTMGITAVDYENITGDSYQAAK